MGLYNFKARFVPFILDGSKTHTIRGKRRYPDKPGNLLYLYTGLRTKEARLLLRPICKAVDDIRIELSETKLWYRWRIIVNGDDLTGAEMQALAWEDGFREKGRKEAPRGMMEFWKGRLPFRGDIIHWK
jgi:hypothetical protein